MHRLSRYLLQLISAFALGSLLFTQATLAAQACRLPVLVPAAAFVGEPEASSCCDNKNLCLTHCTQSYQASDSGKAVVIPGSWPAKAIAIKIAVTAPRLSYFQPSILAHETNAPVCVRYCRFLN